MKKVLLALGCGLSLAACGLQSDVEDADVEAEVVVQGLNYPSSLAYVRTTSGPLTAGTVLVGLAGSTGDRSNSVVSVSPAGAVSRFVDESTRAAGGRVLVSRPTALDARGPFIALTNFANAIGSIAFLEFTGSPLTAALRNGLFDATDFGFTVTEIRPPDGTIVNSLSVTPQVFLSQPVDPNTVTGSRFSLDRVGSSLDPTGHVEFAPDFRSMTFIPDGTLIPGITYRVNISTALRDVNGNGFDSDPFSTQRQSFQSSFQVSGRAPVLRVRAVSPANQETNVPLNSKVVIGFSLPVDPSTITSQSVFVTNAGQQPIPGSLSVSSDRITVSFTPSQNYAVSTGHRVNVTTAVRDEDGNSFDADPGGDPTPFLSTFTTASVLDSTPPTVIAVDPPNGTVAPPQTSVSVTFSEAIDASTVTSNSFRLERSGNRINGSISVSENALIATLTPNQPLPVGETFTMIVTTDVTDRSANRLAQTFQSTFSTQAVSVVINEVIPDPQRDWSDSDLGNGVPFDGTPGVETPTDSDEWIELHNPSNQTFDISGWTLEMRDSSPVTLVIGSPPSTSFEVYSSGSSATSFRPGAYLVIGNPNGEINNDAYLILRDRTSNLVDDVEIGDDPENDGNGDGAPDPGVDGNASSAGDEAVARRPNGSDTNNDIQDFEKQTASIGDGNRTTSLAPPALPGIDGGVTGIVYGGPAPDEPGPFSHLYFVASSNNEGILAVDLDDALYHISDFFNPRGLAFMPGDTPGSGDLYVVHASEEKATDASAGSGLTRIEIVADGPVGASGTRARVGDTENGAIVAVVSPDFGEPVSVTVDPESGLVYVVNRDDSSILEIDFSGRPEVVRRFETKLPPDRLTAIEFGERNGDAGLFLADDGGNGIDGGPQGRLLFVPLP